MAKQKVKKGKSITFQEVVEKTVEIKDGYKNGLKALGKHSNKIAAHNTNLIGGSVDIDDCTRKKYPQANRWDYVIDYNAQLYFAEVHSANTSEVSVVIAKLQWLKDWLNASAQELNKRKAKGFPYYWIQSGNFNILMNSPQFRLAAKTGIMPIRVLNLK